MSLRALSRNNVLFSHPFASVVACLAVGLVLGVSLVGTTGAGALGGGQQASGPATAYSPPGSRCSEVKLPVSLGAGGPKSDTIAGQLCVPSGATPSTVQVLLAGATYDRHYWNPAYQPQTYSYVRAANAAGYATLDIDPLGTGLSSHPLSVQVTIQSTAYTVHQVVGAARSGTLGPAFSRVILVSHSMGTAVAWNEIANYQDVDALIATGNVHIPSALGALSDTLTLSPAFLDPAFAKAGLDPGYLTTRPGTRGSDFYNSSDADPGLIRYDESVKQTMTATFLATYFAEDVDLDSSRIRVPVLIATGQDDGLMCGGLLGANCSTASTLLNTEALFYGPATCLQSYVLPNAGHDMNLSVGSGKFFSVANRWANRWVGTSGNAPKAACTGPVGPAT